MRALIAAEEVLDGQVGVVLGVVKGRHYDEFDVVGLGRHRDTEDWSG